MRLRRAAMSHATRSNIRAEEISGVIGIDSPNLLIFIRLINLNIRSVVSVCAVFS
jgi:hypothetical protein